jgi:hypothetical protein
VVHTTVGRIHTGSGGVAEVAEVEARSRGRIEAREKFGSGVEKAGIHTEIAGRRTGGRCQAGHLGAGKGRAGVRLKGVGTSCEPPPTTQRSLRSIRTSHTVPRAQHNACV